MPANHPIKMPAGFATATAVGYADSSGELVVISSDNPLPVSSDSSTVGGSGVPEPLTGTASGSTVVGPFTPAANRPVFLQLEGSWVGVVRLLRSVDGGTTMLPVTLAGDPWAVFTTNVVEPVWQDSENGAELYLHVELSSGSIDYRVSQ